MSVWPARTVTAPAWLGRWLSLFTSVAVFCIFYRELIASGFDKVPGDDGDALLILYTLEHWYRWLFLGEGAWLASSSFFPLTNTLGYTEAMFLLGLPFAVVRSLGVDLITSYQITLLLVHIGGYAAFYYLLRSALGLGRVPALLGASLATLNNAFYVSMNHPQLFTVALVPMALLLFVAFLRKANGPARARRVAGAGLAVLLPLMLYTSYYVTWFLAFFSVLVAVALLLVDGLARSGVGAAAVGRWLRAHKGEMLVYTLVGLTALTPFIVTYLPILREAGGRPFAEVRATLPSWFDFVNVGTSNVFWSQGFGQEFPEAGARPFHWELEKGVSPPVLLLLVVAAVWGIRASLSTDRPVSGLAKPGLPHAESVRLAGRDRLLPALAGVLAVSVLLAWLLQLRVGEHSAWWLIHKVFPGGIAIRAVFRLQHVLAFAISTAIAVAFHVLWERHSGSPGWIGVASRVLVVGGAALVMAGELNAGQAYRVSKSALQADLQKVAPPPSECRAFFVTPPEPPTPPSYAVNTKAMLIAQRSGIPTLNGHTSGLPPGWSLSDVYAPDYVMRVVAWLELHQMHDGICSLSLETSRWSRFDLAAAPEPVRLEAPLADSGYQVELEVLDPPQIMRPGDERAVSVRVRNLGTATLSGLGAPDGRFAVRLSYQWTGPDGKPRGFNYRKDLPAAVKPGESIVMSADLQAPSQPGLYRLDLDLVQELIAWFRDRGARPYSTEIAVAGSAEPSR
jgi:hypothetical protein